uniref:Uncharacterized protein n=1 Tax=Tanacetum cinerariifolium TaxID=118510 RepID=A0A699GFV0_TANCI|nr:hypothetical protein [Tanacetum cinerariifolium]
MAQSRCEDCIEAVQSAFYSHRLHETALELRTERMPRSCWLRQSSTGKPLRSRQNKLKLRSIVVAQSEALIKLAAEVSDLRKFALVAIDDARGEIRTWKYGAAYLESQRQLDSRLLETFRQKAYRSGADIPDLLKKT